MMRRQYGYALAVAALLSSGAATASTDASLTLAGDGVDLNLGIDTSGATFEPGSFDVALAPGASLEETFVYTVRVTDDGKPATRDWTFCTPITDTDCGPAPTGREQAYASIWIGRDADAGSDNDYWIDDTTTFNSFQSVTGTQGLYTGTIDYMATNTSSYLPQFTTVFIMAAVFADVSAVPEPAAWRLVLLALALAAGTRLVPRRAPSHRVTKV